MKKRLYLISTIFLAAGALSLSSCLKDKNFVDFSKAGTLVELPLEAYNGVGKLVAAALPIQTTPQTVSLVVNLASAKPLGTDLTVTLAVDQAALTGYNHANGLDTGTNVPYTLPPANSYTFASLKVTIPAGKQTATLNIQVLTSNLDPGGKYILPISITDGGGQKISNYKTILFNLQAKNKYDGRYTVDGTMNDTVNPAFTSLYPRTVDLATISANDVGYYDVAQGDFLHPFASGGTVSVYGEFAGVFTFDAANKITAVTNYYGQPSPTRARSARIDVTGVNALSGTPGQAGSVIKVKYVLVQAGADRTFFDETFTYKSARP